MGDFDSLNRLVGFGLRAVIDQMRADTIYGRLFLSDEEKIKLFVKALDRDKRNTSDITLVLRYYPTLFRDVCEEVLHNVLIEPLFEFIPAEATIPGVTEQEYREWYTNLCERGIPLRPMEIKYIAKTPVPWYHHLCIVALQNEPESITEIPKRVLGDNDFVELVALPPSR